MDGSIRIEATTGEIPQRSLANATLEDFLRLNQLPPSLFQGYVVAEGRRTPVPLTRRMSDLSGEEVVLSSLRFLEFSKAIPSVVSTYADADPVTTLRDRDYSAGAAREAVYEISAPTARELVGEAVAEFMDAQHSGDSILVGVSGGGDSNALTTALASWGNAKGVAVTGYTLQMDPVWGSDAVERAAAICTPLGVHHEVLGPERIGELLHLPIDLADWYQQFRDAHGASAIHLFGTFLVSLVGRRLARDLGGKQYCLGFNQEDVLAEVLFLLVNGRRPLPYPVRSFGDIELLMPAWRVPKRILDACHPQLSSQAYEERNRTEAGEGTTWQRSMVYLLSHAIADAEPSLASSLLQGLATAIDGDWQELEDEDHDVFRTDTAPDDVMDWIDGWFEG